MIRKIKGGYAIFSKTTGRKLSKIYKRSTSPALKKREKQIIYFKHKK